MTIIYLKLLELLGEIEAIKFIDLDTGQLDVPTRPAVAFPCALIEIELTDCEDIGAKQQNCTAVFSLRLGFNISESTTSLTPEDRRLAALSYFGLVNEVFKKMQGFYNNELGRFSRKKAYCERRADGLKVLVMPFETTFRDVSAA